VSDEFDFTTVGGMLHVMGDETEVWNFGLLPGECRLPAVETVAPQVAGNWDGKTSISHWIVTEQVLGKVLPAQKQPRGTCVARGFTGACNVLQCIQIATGKRKDKFQPLSHAWIYGGARTLSGMLGGGDGAMGPDAAEWAKRYGCLTQKEAGDEDYYSDTLAIKWGGRGGVDNSLKPTAADNIVIEMATCTTFSQAADVIASGGVVTVASNQGFSMTRDSEGVCRAQGSWAHQMFFGAVMVTPSGKRVLGCAQSWGENVPSGPQLPGCPSYVFGVEESVANRMLGQRSSVAISGFVGWVDPNPKPDTPWVF
jgi:hypothetical protein